MDEIIDKSRQIILLDIARASISNALDKSYQSNTDPIDENAEWLQQQGACFITLMLDGQLRGCVGTLTAHRSLLDDVKSNARAAAFKDNRFSPLTAQELDSIEIEISLLSSIEPLTFNEEAQALAQLRPGIDGVIFEDGFHRSTFLPQVWQQLPDVQTFITHLKQKAGVATDYWSEQTKLSRYTVSKFKESTFTEQTFADTENEKLT